MMEKRCNRTDRIMEFLDGSLDASQNATFRNHLKDCPECRKALEEIQFMQDRLGERKRPPVPEAVLRSYEKGLREAFPVQPIRIRLGLFLKNALWEWIPKSRPYAQLAGALGVLLVGVIIGRFVLYPGTSGRMDTGVMSEAVVPQSDRELVIQFLTQSEIWLLEMASTPVNGSDSKLDLLTNREIATTLLARTMLMERMAEDLNQNMLLTFLNRLEMVLLETSGARDEELHQAFEEIRQTIRETALIQEVKRIRRTIRILPGEEA